MIISLSLSLVGPLLLGIVVTSFVWPPRGAAHAVLKGSIAPGLGFGLFSILFFLWLLVIGSSKGFILFERTLYVPLLAVLYYLVKKQRQTSQVAAVLDTPSGTAGILRKLWFIFFFIFALSFIAFIFMTLKHPHGGRDAWSVWNARARYIFLSGEHWIIAFSNSLELPHLDYPLLVPLSVARGWEHVGSATTAMPAVIAMVFTFSIVSLLVSALFILRSGMQGLLAGLILLGTPDYVDYGAIQNADIPLGFFFLLTMVLLAFHDRNPIKGNALLILAGISAGMSAWTKNEGLLFIVAILAGRTMSLAQKREWKAYTRQMLFFSLGLAPISLLIMYFKVYIAPPNDIVLGQGVHTLSKLVDPDRYVLVLEEFFVTAMTTIRCGLPLMAIYLFLLGANKEVRGMPTINTGLATLAFMLAGFFMIYVVTPIDLKWHLETSLDRLFIQLWPTCIFIFFMLANAPDQVLTANQKNEGHLSVLSN